MKQLPLYTEVNVKGKKKGVIIGMGTNKRKVVYSVLLPDQTTACCGSNEVSATGKRIVLSKVYANPS